MHNQTTHAYEQLRGRILNGVLKPAESLTELSLAAELGVSRNTVKKALLMLERENLVIIEENKRAVVRSFSIEEVVHYLEVRELLEGLVVREAMGILKDSDLDAMAAILDEMKDNLEQGKLKEYSQGNWRFHEIIYNACPNRPAVDIVLSIKNQLKRYNVKTIFIPGRGDKSYTEHLAILSALRERDSEKAELLVRAHISTMRNLLRQHHELLF